MTYNMTSAMLSYAKDNNIPVNAKARRSIMNPIRINAVYNLVKERAQPMGLDMTDEQIRAAIMTFPSAYSAGWKGAGVMSDRIIRKWIANEAKDEAEKYLARFSTEGEGEGDETGDGSGDGEGEGEGEGRGDGEPSPEPSPRDGEGEGEGEGEGDGSGDREGDDEDPVPEPEPEPTPEEEEEEDGEDFYIRPEKYEIVKALVSMGKKVLLVGPRGTGKTELAFRVAKDLKKELFMLTSPQMRTDVTGYADATGREVMTQVTMAITEPGLLLLEEMDRSMPEALIPLNAMLANDVMDVPVRGVVKVNPRMRVIATANTNGHGATEEYGTANRLDGSTLDRFCVVRVDYEERITHACVESSGLNKAETDAVTKMIEEFRASCLAQGLDEYIPSYRGAKTFADIVAGKDPYFGSLDEATRIRTALEVALLKDAVTKDTLATILGGMKCRNRYAKALVDYQASMKEVF